MKRFILEESLKNLLYWLVYFFEKLFHTFFNYNNDYLEIFLGRCFVNGPGASIGGADYRRDYEISLKDCAITCREDHCCMAFEWTSDGTCTLKSRSLNGTIVNANGVHFGLCLDTGELPHLLISKQLSLISKQVKETVYENQPNICVQPIPSVNHQMTFSAKKESNHSNRWFNVSHCSTTYKMFYADCTHYGYQTKKKSCQNTIRFSEIIINGQI